METHKSIVFILQLLVAYLLTCSHGQIMDDIDRNDFPPNFIFGAASSAYQYEGAANADGRQPSIWDTFTEEHPEKIQDRSSGKVAEEFYYRYKNDIGDRLKPMGVDSFRFSISWSRVLRNVDTHAEANPKGVQFYKSLITTLLNHNIEPIVTLFHWDVPQALENKYNGFLGSDFVKDYLIYVEFCFKTFGDKVKKWITFNEPYIFTTNAYEFGGYAPGRCSHFAGNCTSGNSGTEPYIVIHHLLLAHAKAVELYRKHYQADQKGIIGITVHCIWMVPKYHTPESSLAAYRALDFMIGWLIHPITYGEYPEIMRSWVGCRLPNFTKEESKLLKGSMDFLGLNYYTARYVENNDSCVMNPSPLNDERIIFSSSKDGIPIGKQIANSWMFVYPEGIKELVMYVKENYKNPPMYITENGTPDAFDDPDDKERIDYHRSHLQKLLEGIKAGANVKGYYSWTFLDCFEWSSGYTLPFGLYHVDRKDNLKRTPKGSVAWFKKFLKPMPRSALVSHKKPDAASLLSTT